MAQLFANNVSTKLDLAVQNYETTMVVLNGSAMPSPTVGDFFLLTLAELTDGKETAWEIVKVTARTGNTLTVVRGQEGTIARFWGGGAKVELRFTAGAFSGLSAQIGDVESALIAINGV